MTDEIEINERPDKVEERLEAKTQDELDMEIRIKVIEMGQRGYWVTKRDLVGNDRCHCGSGKLYKNCCKGMDDRVYDIAKEMGCAKPPANVVSILKNLSDDTPTP